MSEKKRILQKIAIGIILLVIAALIGGRIYLPHWVKGYINHEIANLKGYKGSVADVDIHLWRGAYTIYGLEIFKTGADIPVPFVDVKKSDLSIDWRALFDGAIVAEIDLYNADLNFAIGRDNRIQTGEGAGWSHFVDTLSPLDINRLNIHGGKLSFQDFSTNPKVDIFVKDIALQVENLKDVKENNKTLPSPVHLTGNSIGGGKVNATGAMNIIRDIPDFDFNIKLEGARLPAINDYTRAIASFDFEKGSLSIYSEAAARNGHLTGYIKPIATDVSIVSLEHDHNPFSIIWQSLVAVFAEIFKNHTEDQLATRIPLEGNLNNPKTDSWSAFVSIFRNTFHAFIHDTDNTVDFSHVERQ